MVSIEKVPFIKDEGGVPVIEKRTLRRMVEGSVLYHLKDITQKHEPFLKVKVLCCVVDVLHII